MEESRCGALSIPLLSFWGCSCSSAGGALHLLYTHDDQRQQLIRDPSLIPDAIEECLRLRSNGYFTFPRIARRNTEVGGTRILKGMVVRPSPLAPNYDPDVFPIHRGSISTASQSASSHLAPAPTIASATSWVAPLSASRYAFAGALSESAHQRSRFHADLWRRCWGVTASEFAYGDPLKRDETLAVTASVAWCFTVVVGK